MKAFPEIKINSGNLTFSITLLIRKIELQHSSQIRSLVQCQSIFGAMIMNYCYSFNNFFY